LFGQPLYCWGGCGILNKKNNFKFMNPERRGSQELPSSRRERAVNWSRVFGEATFRSSVQVLRGGRVNADDSSYLEWRLDRSGLSSADRAKVRARLADSLENGKLVVKVSDLESLPTGSPEEALRRLLVGLLRGALVDQQGGPVPDRGSAKRKAAIEDRLRGKRTARGGKGNRWSLGDQINED
jgi:hypothetical protein